MSMASMVASAPRVLECVLTIIQAVVRVLEAMAKSGKRHRGWPGSYGNAWDVILGLDS